ncbi:NADP-dependent 3-hydroxy acid dehydrogenase YdfG [Filimonas lacunae]|uniref:NADP-dependent 3-hydroxy acid dehydrogenase YdfG n=1 Tax=Filimonas lacunae TaxID=477680 RepID=A0A173MBN4_9BACT|nr:SDR family oxidoreductase [Filimonas lacunae]BAV04909.1 short-chain dehydrogenase [Filimonas lacunae]SIT33817.1 NADP-dependent 3-hydroxy acid dehydrogenase YdfG [Filimonas lacunae]
MKKVVVITGSSSGFGMLTAITLAGKGYTVVATMRHSKGYNQPAAGKLREQGIAEVVDMDVTDDTSVQQAISGILSRYGRIDILINNAGVYSGGVLEAFSIEQVKRVFETNVFGILRVNNEVLPGMRARKEGLIINISSSVGRVSPPLQAPYNASKFAVEALVEASHAELSTQGIETVLIEPGAFLTDIWGKQGLNADRAGIAESYGQDIADMQQHIQQVFGKILEEQKPDPQLVADKILALIEMKAGKRPLRNPVDPAANGADIAYNEATIAAAAHWMVQYGF